MKSVPISEMDTCQKGLEKRLKHLHQMVFANRTWRLGLNVEPVRVQPAQCGCKLEDQRPTLR